jgi:hypothetical protein
MHRLTLTNEEHDQFTQFQKHRKIIDFLLQYDMMNRPNSTVELYFNEEGRFMGGKLHQKFRL